MARYEDIKELVSRPERAWNSVLTLYLNVDQSLQANLNRGFETEFRSLLAALRATIKDENELQHFDAAAVRIAEFLAAYHVNRRALALVFDTADSFLWIQEFDFPIANALRWGCKAFTEPLGAAAGERDPVAIAVADRAKLRLFFMVFGELREHAEETFDRRSVRHTKTAGMDAIASDSHAGHKADEQVRRNLKRMAARIRKEMSAAGARRLILAGSPELTAELAGLLPKRLAAQIVARVNIASTATPARVRAEALPILEQCERKAESEIVNELTTAAAKAAPVVLGCARSLHAVNEGRVWRLVYAPSFHSPGYECSRCGALFSAGVERCSTCAAPVRRMEDVIEYAVDHAIRKGARIEVIRGEDAESTLINAGGIGAFLRTRSRTARAS